MSSILSLRANEAMGAVVCLFAFLLQVSTTSRKKVLALKKLLPNLYGEVDQSGPRKGV